MSRVLNKEAIKEYLPHREPMLLIDEAWLSEDKQTAFSKTGIRGDEYFLQGHFPGNPIVPGVIQCEIMAQTCSMLLLEDVKGKTPLFTSMNNVKFKGKVFPGDVFEVEAAITRSKGPFYFTHCKAKVDGKLVCEGDLSYVVTEGE